MAAPFPPAKRRAERVKCRADEGDSTLKISDSPRSQLTEVTASAVERFEDIRMVQSAEMHRRSDLPRQLAGAYSGTSGGELSLGAATSSSIAG
jgi:hypothetical protein